MTTNVKKPTVKLTGSDGNAFAIIGACTKAGRAAGWTPEQVTAFRNEATSGDYANVLMTAGKYFTVK